MPDEPDIRPCAARHGYAYGHALLSYVLCLMLRGVATLTYAASLSTARPTASAYAATRARVRQMQALHPDSPGSSADAAIPGSGGGRA